MESHLLQMRGLKPKKTTLQNPRYPSHLLQMRGLKPVSYSKPDIEKRVASFTDAWIET